MQSKLYHSGLKLRVLRELKGLKEKELAEALNCDFDNILLWEKEGVPDDILINILDFFDVGGDFFSTEVHSDLMLTNLAISESSRPELVKELNKRLDIYRKNNLTYLDLSSLGLLKIPDVVFELKQLIKIDLSDNLLSKIPSKLQNFIESGGELIIRKNFIDSKIPTTYNITKQEANKPQITSNSSVEEIKFISLKLEHIGIYENLTIDFNNELTMFIGVNGAGKTTILKALSLAILGARDSVKRQALSLRNVDVPVTTNSKITLTATVDDIKYSHEIIFSHNSDTNEIDITEQPFAALYNAQSVLKNLILCLGEQRNNSLSEEKSYIDKQPRIMDLLPLLRGDDQSCMKGFTSWWAKLEHSKKVDPEAQGIIDLCFKVFSRFMGENIQPDGLRKVTPHNELWIKYDSGKSVPLHLASQGYQSVMGWVGFIIQRMIEVNALNPSPLGQPSIIIIDEIDQLLSVKWQYKIISILREFFPKIQWIISTHSPIILTDLDRKQIVKLHEFNGNVITETNEVDLWMWEYGDIIRRYFEINTIPPKYQEETLIKEIESNKKKNVSDNDSKTKLLEDRLEKVKASAAAIDKYEKQLQSLKNKEQQLDVLIKKLQGAND
jgi:predicted ATPase/transcriptional regulator with XRE-family HTH domain